MKSSLLAWIIISIVLNVAHQLSVNSSAVRAAKLLFASDYIAMLISGMVFYRMFMKKEDRLYNYLILILCVVSQYLAFGTINTLIFLNNCILMLVFAWRKGSVPDFLMKVMSNKAILYIATISYPFYLLHNMIVLAVIYNIRKAGFTNEIGLIIPGVIIVLLSTFVHRYVEVPGSRITLNVLNTIEEKVPHRGK